MTWLKKLLGYLLPIVSGAVGVAVGQKLGPVAGAAAGGAVATVGARVLHLQEPPR